MCLVVDRNIHPKIFPFRAKENIAVYKVLAYNGCFIGAKPIWETPFMNHPVNFVNGRAIIHVPPIFSHFKENPFSAFDLKQSWLVKYEPEPDIFGYSYGENDEVIINEGVHAFTTKESTLDCSILNEPTFLFEATIPTGARFFVGSNNDIVCDCLVVFNNGNMPQSLNRDDVSEYIRADKASIPIDQYLEKYKHNLYE